MSQATNNNYEVIEKISNKIHFESCLAILPAK